MNEIINKIKSKINELNYRINQLNYSKKNIKFYYAEKISIIKQEIKDLEAQIIYFENFNDNEEVDIHGATKYFVEYYLDDLLYYKMTYHQKVKLITGKGTYTLFNSVKKYLNNENLKYKIIDNNFIIDLY